MGAQFQLGEPGTQDAAELRILLVYLSQSLGRLGQNGGPLGATFFIEGGGPPLPPSPRRTAPRQKQRFLLIAPVLMLYW